MSKPIRPQDIGAAKTMHIPAAVFDAFNAEIARRFADGAAAVRQSAVVERLIEGGMRRDEIFSSGWLNIEDAYREAGWKVAYDKPGHNEDGEPFFIFKAL